jgi:hypothetical protein
MPGQGQNTKQSVKHDTHTDTLSGRKLATHARKELKTASPEWPPLTSKIADKLEAIEKPSPRMKQWNEDGCGKAHLFKGRFSNRFDGIEKVLKEVLDQYKKLLADTSKNPDIDKRKRELFSIMSNTRADQNYVLGTLNSVESFHFLASRHHVFAEGHRNILIGSVRKFLSKHADDLKINQTEKTLNEFRIVELDKSLLADLAKFQKALLDDPKMQIRFRGCPLTAKGLKGLKAEYDSKVFGEYSLHCMFPTFQGDGRDAQKLANPEEKGAHLSDELTARFGEKCGIPLNLLFKVEDSIDELKDSKVQFVPGTKTTVADFIHEIRKRQSGWFNQRNLDQQYDEITAGRAYLIEDVRAPIVTKIKQVLNNYFAKNPDSRFEVLKAEDPYFDARLTKAVKLFQLKNSLRADGVIGLATLDTLVPEWKYTTRAKDSIDKLTEAESGTRLGRKLDYFESTYRVPNSSIRVSRNFLNNFVKSENAYVLPVNGEGLNDSSSAYGVEFPWPREERRKNTGSTGITIAAGFDVGQMAKSRFSMERMQKIASGEYKPTHGTLDWYLKEAGWMSWIVRKEPTQQKQNEKLHTLDLIYQSTGKKGPVANAFWRSHRSFLNDVSFDRRLAKNLFAVVVDVHRDRAKQVYERWVSKDPSHRKHFDELKPSFQNVLTDLMLRGDLCLRLDSHKAGRAAIFSAANDSDYLKGVKIINNPRYFGNAHASDGVRKRHWMRKAYLALADCEKKEGIQHLDDPEMKISGRR